MDNGLLLGRDCEVLTMQNMTKIYTIAAPISTMFDRNEQTVAVTPVAGDEVRVVISGLINVGHLINRTISDVTMSNADFEKYILPGLPKTYKEVNP